MCVYEAMYTCARILGYLQRALDCCAQREALLCGGGVFGALRRHIGSLYIMTSEKNEVRYYIFEDRDYDILLRHRVVNILLSYKCMHEFRTAFQSEIFFFIPSRVYFNVL